MARIEYFAVALLIVLAGQRGYGMSEITMSGEYMVCKPVAGVFDTIAGGKNSSEKGIMPVLQGPVGAPGLPGKTGLPGPQGQPDYGKVSKIIGERVQSINARLFKLEKEVADLKAGGGGGGGTPGQYVAPTRSAEEVRIENECLNKFSSPISEGTMCYRIIGGEGLLWDFRLADSNCTKLGGNLADLNSRSIYDKIYNYVDLTYSTVVQAWTGMRFEDNDLLLRDGTKAVYAKWSTGYPRSSTTSYYSSYKNVYIYMDTSAYIRRLSNTRSSTKRPYAICSFNVNGNNTTSTSAPTTTP